VFFFNFFLFEFSYFGFTQPITTFLWHINTTIHHKLYSKPLQHCPLASSLPLLPLLLFSKKPCFFFTSSSYSPPAPSQHKKPSTRMTPFPFLSHSLPSLAPHEPLQVSTLPSSHKPRKPQHSKVLPFRHRHITTGQDSSTR